MCSEPHIFYHLLYDSYETFPLFMHVICIYKLFFSSYLHSQERCNLCPQMALSCCRRKLTSLCICFGSRLRLPQVQEQLAVDLTSLGSQFPPWKHKHWIMKVQEVQTIVITSI